MTHPITYNPTIAEVERAKSEFQRLLNASLTTIGIAATIAIAASVGLTLLDILFGKQDSR